MINRLSNPVVYLFAITVAFAVNIYSWHLPFFWDTILTSSITQHFYENGFHNFITPPGLDAGHPPLFYIYVTGFYHLLGRSLFAAHLSMLPFIIIGIISFLRILQFFGFTMQQRFLGIVLFFSVPAVLTQYTLVSYDAVLLSLYLAAFASFLYNGKFLFSIILVAIAGISLRGLFCLTAISITIFFILNSNKIEWIKWNIRMVPAVALGLIWYYFHYTQTGWFLSTKNSGWSEHRGFVNAFGFLKNGISIARCFTDLGIVILSFLSIFYIFQKRKLDVHLWIWLIPFLVFSILFLPFSNPVNHRYYLIVYVLMLPSVIRFLSGKGMIYSVLTVLLLVLGHLVIYPGKISNGWDCTVAHGSYFPLRNDFNRYLEASAIDKHQVGSVFPMIVSDHQADMKMDTARMINVNGSSIYDVPYLLYSNIGNDFSDEQIDSLQKWIRLKEERKGLVSMILFRNPEYHPK